MTENPADFAQRYLETWTEPDPVARRGIIEAVWAPDGRLVVSSLGTSVTGVPAIDTHIAHVHDDLIAGRGLRFSYDGWSEAEEALLLRWSMSAPDGSVVGRGADLVFRDPDGAVRTVYMFMGVE